MTFIITCACPGILFNNMTNFRLLEFEELCALVYPTVASTARSTGQEEAPTTQEKPQRAKSLKAFQIQISSYMKCPKCIPPVPGTLIHRNR